jgi:hypothetical protein
MIKVRFEIEFNFSDYIIGFSKEVELPCLLPVGSTFHFLGDDNDFGMELESYGWYEASGEIVAIFEPANCDHEELPEFFQRFWQEQGWSHGLTRKRV